MRGSVLDGGTLLILVFVLAAILVPIAFVGSKLTSTGNPTLDSYTNTAHQGTLSLNTIAPFLVLAIGFALIVSAAAIRTHPALFFVFLVVNMIFAYASLFLANAWEAAFIAPAGELSTVAGGFNAWTWMWQYAPFISIILGVIFAAVVYAKGG